MVALTMLLNILSADAYSAIVVSDNGEGSSWAYQYFLSTPAGYGSDPSRSEIEHWALERCRQQGGVNPKVVLSTRKRGYFAIATGRAGTKNQAHRREKSVVGWAGPLSSPQLASREAIRNCANRGGINPQVKAHWRDQ
jgi:Domain of unknown function (DUF4189)